MYEAADWYYQQSPRLADTLMSRIEDRLRDIFDQPDRFARHAIGCRYTKVTKFPYVLFFNATDQFVDVLGLAHVSRSHEKWRQRIN